MKICPYCNSLFNNDKLTNCENCEAELIKTMPKTKIQAPEQKIIKKPKTTKHKNFLKITAIFLTIVFVIIGITQYINKDNTDSDNKNAPSNPITSIKINNTNLALQVGDSYNFSATITPIDTDEKTSIIIGDESIIEYKDGKIIAKKQGETFISFNPEYYTQTNIKQSCSIRVIDFEYSSFKTKYQAKLERSTLKVFCKFYNTNFLGIETKSKTIEGRGVIVEYSIYTYKFLTDVSLFNEISGYDKQKWYVEDYLGEQHSINGINYHIKAGIALGSFAVNKANLQTLNVFNGYAYNNEYAISNIGNPLADKIIKGTYQSIYSNLTVNVFYHTVALSSKLHGIAIVNHNCEIIGINMDYTQEYAIAVSAIEIRELLYPSKNTGGGPIDIF